MSGTAPRRRSPVWGQSHSTYGGPLYAMDIMDRAQETRAPCSACPRSCSCAPWDMLRRTVLADESMIARATAAGLGDGPMFADVWLSANGRNATVRRRSRLHDKERTVQPKFRTFSHRSPCALSSKLSLVLSESLVRSCLLTLPSWTSKASASESVREGTE